MQIKKLSIIVPCYNEISTIAKVISALQGVDFRKEKEIIIVDDGSTDGTREYLEKLSIAKAHYIILFHEKNKGKGAAIQTALEKATGDYVIIQDADLEYNPQDINTLIACAEKKETLAVYGSRNKDIKNSYLYPHFFWGSRLLTFLINALYRQKVTDPETCYKLIDRNFMRFIDISEKGFGVEMEVTLKIMKLGVSIYEESITYNPRGFRQGKKIKAKDGLWALYLIFWHAFHDMNFGPIDCFLRHLRVNAVKRFFQNISGKNVLDVGCGRQGHLGWKYKNNLRSYVGLDTKAKDLTIQNLSFIRGDIKDISVLMSEKKFDIIAALAIIEHIDNPEKFFEDCTRLLASGGIIILTTPAPMAHPILHLMSRMGIIDKNEINCHKRYFSLDEIVRLLEKLNFEIIFKKRFLFGLNSALVARKK